MSEAGRRDPEARGVGALHHDLRQGGGGEIVIARLFAQREVAHRAADEARLLALAVERPQRARQPALVDEAPVGEAPVANGGKAAHSKCPGTSAPLSTWAGT